MSRKHKPQKKATPADAVNPAPVTAHRPPGQNRLVTLAAVICAIIAFALYANTLGHEYTVDDGTVISNNTITKKGVSAIPEIFTSAYRAGFWDRNEGLYRPLSVAMFAVEWEFWPENPAPGHWINVLLYALTAFLLMITLSRMFSKYSLLFPFTVTLLFVIHPIHTEVVANIKSRDEILCFIFSILTIFYLERFLKNSRPVYLLAALLVYFLAFLSKESAITMLGVIPLVLWFFDKVSIRNIFIRTLPFLAVAAAYMLIRYQVLGELKGSPLLQLVNNSLLGAESMNEQLATAITIMGSYIYLLFIPHPLSFDYSYNQIPVVGFGNAVALLSVATLGAMIYLSVKGFINKSPAAFGLLFFFVTISLVSNILFLIESTMAERFLYLPSLGFIIAVAYYLLRFFNLLEPEKINGLTGYFKLKPLFTAFLGCIFILYSFKTISRNRDWKNNLTLLSKDVVTCPESARIRYAYGSALLIEQALKEENKQVKNGILLKSVAQLQKGVEILPSYAEAWNHLGVAYKELENYPAAVNAFDKARSYKEFKEAEFYISAGLAYGNAKLYDKAIADFTKAISIDPTNAEAYNNKGLYLFEKGAADSSLYYFEKAITLKKDFYQAYYNKGNTIAGKGDYTAAIALYEEALKHKPGYVDALLNMGNSFAAMKDYSRALEYYSKVEQQEPGNKKVLINTGITYRILGNEQMANEYFERANKAGTNQ